MGGKIWMFLFISLFITSVHRFRTCVTCRLTGSVSTVVFDIMEAYEDCLCTQVHRAMKPGCRKHLFLNISH